MTQANAPARCRGVGCRELLGGTLALVAEGGGDLLGDISLMAFSYARSRAVGPDSACKPIAEAILLSSGPPSGRGCSTWLWNGSSSVG